LITWFLLSAPIHLFAQEAKPKAILQRMGAYGAQLTTIQVKSHLQKHRPSSPPQT
jgi:SHAQKYF class myb-like DNA-binding protein